MKKIVLGLAALAIVATSTQVMAAAALKPKANVCLDFVSFSDYHILAIKPSGTVKIADGVVKLFQILGHAQGIADHPVTGNGYVLPGTTIFHATYSGQGRTGSVNVNRIYELFFDLFTQSGTIFSHFDYDDGTKFASDGTGVVSTDCKVLPLAGLVTGTSQQFEGQD